MAKFTGLGVDERFFDYPRESSRVKQKIVVDYFLSWSNVLASLFDRVDAHVYTTDLIMDFQAVWRRDAYSVKILSG